MDKGLISFLQRRPTRRFLVLVVIFLALLYIGSLCLIGASPLRIVFHDWIADDMARDLANAERTWRGVAIDSYEIDVRFGMDTASVMCGGGSESSTLLVIDGEVVAVNGEEIWAFCDSIFEDLTVVSMLDRATKAVESYDPRERSLRIRYDSEWGYVVFYDSDIPFGLGQPAIGGFHSFVIVDDFRPLE